MRKWISKIGALLFVLACSSQFMWIAHGQVSFVEVPSPEARDNSLFGLSVAMDAERLVVGAPGAGPDTTGAAYVFARQSNGTWLQVSVLLPPDGQLGDAFGWSVAIDGGLIVVGSPQDDAGPNVPDVGSVYVFEEGEPGDWTFLDKLDAPKQDFLVEFGRSVSISGNFVAVGSPGNIEASVVGEAYVFERSGTGWDETLIAPDDGQTGDAFGKSVAISEQGTLLVVGADRNDEAGPDAGAAYVFQRTGSAWDSGEKLLASDAERSDRFGTSVSIENGEIVVGAPFTDHSPSQSTESGSLYLFSGNTGAWVESSIIIMNFPFGQAGFGASTSMSGDRIVGGTPGGNSAHAFVETEPSSFTETQVSHPFEGSGGFGSAVSLSGSLLAVGAPTESNDFRNIGTVFVFQLQNRPPDLLDIPSQFISEGQMVQVPVSAIDLDGDRTILSTLYLPGFATFTDNGDRTGTLTLSPSFADAGEYSIFVVATDAISGQATSRDVLVSIADAVPLSAPEIGIAVVDTPLEVRLTVADNLLGNAKTLFVRKAGASNFDQVPFAQAVGNEFEAIVPAELVTERGLDVFVSVELDQNVVTFPIDGPNDPQHVRVDIPTLLADASIISRSYRMMSVPYLLEEGDPSSMLQDNLGTVSPDTWRLLRWNSIIEEYEEYPDVQMEFDPGNAFWLVTGRSDSVDFAQGTSTSIAEPQVLNFETGWNQIGNPFAFAVDWNAIDPDGQLRLPVSFDGESYQYDQSVVEPWEGYFVFNEGEPISLTVPPIESVQQVLLDRSDESTDYVLQIIASRDGLVDSQNFVGLSHEASDGLDHLDILEPPAISNLLRLDVLDGTTRMATNFKRPSRDGVVWELSVSDNPATDDPVTIQFIEHGTPMDGYRPYFVDPESGESISIRDTRTEFVVKGGKENTLSLVLGDADFASRQAELAATADLTSGLQTIYPNPARNQATIVYTLADQMPVQVQVFNVLGQLVATLVDDQEEAGLHRIAFDATSTGGVKLASGLYFVRLNGNGVSSSQTLVIDR